MPVPTANVSGDINAAIGEVSTLRVTAVYSDPVWADETNNAVIVGGGVIPVTSDGLIDVTLPQTNETVRVAINVEYVDNATRQRKSASSGWQELTADVDFATFMATTPTSVPLSTAEALAARIDGYTDHGDVSGVLTIDPATGTHVLNATGSLLVTIDTPPRNGYIVTLYIVGGAESVTVDGMADLELTDGAFASFVRIRGAWVLASAGASAGEPATPDTTPPSAVTDLAVTPGEDGVTATATFSPATDAESTVKYRYRLYATGTTAPAWPTTGAQYNLTGSPINLTGLTAGEDYTMDLQAYSAGGSAAADTATFSTPTPAGWNTWDNATFTAADGTLIADYDTTNGRSYTGTGGAPQILSNKVTDPAAATGGSFGFQMTGLPGGRTRHTVALDATNVEGSHWPIVRTLIGATTGNIGFEIQCAGGVTKLQFLWTYAGVAPTVTYESGYSNDWNAAIPQVGTMVIDVDPTAETIVAYFNGTKIATLDATAWDYGGGPQNFDTTKVVLEGKTQWADVDSHQIEVYT